jgi:predicted lipoprotein
MSRNRYRYRWLAVLVVAILAVTACGDDDGGGEGSGGGDGGGERTESVLRALGEDVIVPSYAGLVESLHGLTSALDTLCATPSAANLDAARTAWQGAAVAWPGTRAGGVGPAMDRRLMGAVGYRARPQTVSALLEGSDPLDPESLDETGAAARGLSAIELLLYDGGAADLTRPGPAGARRCEYARSASTLSGEAAQVVLDDWQGGGESSGEPYAETLVSGVDGGPQSSVSALTNEVAHALQTLDDKGLRQIAAAESAEDLPVTDQDGPGAYGMAQLRGLHAGIVAMVDGPSGDDGLLALVAARDEEVADRLDAALDEATGAIDALPDSIADTFAARDDLTAASEAVAELKVVVGTEVASVLGVTIGFSDADGDS